MTLPPASTAHPSEAPSDLPTALGLALAAAVSLGLARFAYGLVLPAMRSELGWSYFLAGAMNTANAAGYLVGALLMPRLLLRHDARALLLWGGWASAALLAAHAFTRSDAVLLVLRLLCGTASAASFVCGGLLAARLASASGSAAAGAPRHAGLILGLYYGGVGLGIIAASLGVPALVGADPAPPWTGWPGAWLLLGALAALFTAVTARSTRRLHAPPVAPAPGAARPQVGWRPMGWLLAGYLMFGLGYIGYMTFVVTLLREQGRSTAEIVAFYSLLGVGVCASSWLWAGLLQRHRDGRPLARLNALLGLATALPVLAAAVDGAAALVWLSGLLFGAVFLSVVASTTAFVRHNLPPAAWPAGISAFTILFAAGQIVGPGMTGLVADAAGGGVAGLTRGLAVSAGLLLLGALLARRQGELVRTAASPIA
ncbi:YbfB/YjiJ family MFS transporter [Sphaerotilus mobilis]|uniref:Putative MFS family arabinose efflux permease n=1 Tax=Sphaerotilus mobilis TaxID=47994 RepID=A0A4Q7LL32_9BURK|nr:YbfB/YjiJ family MFS transporter [Sphaerotilus mobilis]RZS54873.1 putative MFS family arabinose efflux permease [Sphaerotilus mobilis]